MVSLTMPGEKRMTRPRIISLPPVFDDVAFLATEFREGQDETDPATGSTFL